MSLTRNESYRLLTPYLPESQAKVLASLALTGPQTRSEIAMDADMRLSAVCGRANELLKQGLIENYGMKLDEDTNRLVQVLRIVEVRTEYVAMEVAV